MSARIASRAPQRRTVSFVFDGKTYSGLEGESLASALLANGVAVMGRSFKYHRPRGVLGAGAEEPNALVGVDRGPGRVTPDCRATQVELYEGLKATSQNRWPSLAFDVGVVAEAFSPIMPSGFYYKTFKGPGKAWEKLYEPIIRAAAGLGTPPKDADPDRYQQFYAHCDVLIVGAGPAGLAAALTAGASGARVILCDERDAPGGSLLWESGATIDGHALRDWIAAATARLDALPNVRLLTRTQAFGWYPDTLVGLEERVTDHLADPAPELPRARQWQVRAKEVVIAAGAIERPLVFPGNDRPGVMLADAARTYLARWGVAVGRQALVATSHDHAYRAALDLADAGVAIAAIVDLRADPQGPLIEAAKAARIRVVAGQSVVSTAGRARVSSATLSSGETIACDALLMSGGWTPSVHLFSQSRGKLVYDEASGAFLPGASAAAERSAGGCRGVYSLAACLADGADAGADAARKAGFAPPDAAPPRVAGEMEANGVPADRLAGETPKGKAFIDFQNDVTAKDLALATREGMRSIEHVKRYTTTGMATDQGKTANMNALGVVARETGRAVPQVGLTTYRPPYTPVTFGVFAGAAIGDLFDPLRRTPSDAWARARGAIFEDVALWKRAKTFPRAGESEHAALAREIRAVRETVGLFDASTLGKIEVAGPDAAEFLERIYTNPFKGLKVGHCRYALLLNEQGFVIDDGVVGRLSPTRFHVTTTTGGAPRVLAMMEDYLQTEWPDLKVWLCSLTETWAVAAVQGPKAREIVAPLVDGLDLSNAAFPHMSIAQSRVLGAPARVMRVSFTGELGYEINVAPDLFPALWARLADAVEARGGGVYGTEAMHVLRAEKGYVVVGLETDGTTTPQDIGYGWAVGQAKRDFVGKAGLARPYLQGPNRKQLVGLAPARPLEDGMQLTDRADPPKGTHAIGHVASAYEITTLGRPIALALVENGRARLGETIFAPAPGGAIACTIVTPEFYDPQGARLQGAQSHV